VEVPGHGNFCGDVAWGGNWFYLVDCPDVRIDLSNIEFLTDLAQRIRLALNIEAHPEVDHVELFGPSQNGADSRNFVLCPGKAYDRSPCGTGTSAKLACLAAEGKLSKGEPWVQEGILGSTFTGRYTWLDQAKGEIVPSITGRAYITAESSLQIQEGDPFGWGIR
jgi:4-hydroxyproline epimerase